MARETLVKNQDVQELIIEDLGEAKLKSTGGVDDSDVQLVEPEAVNLHKKELEARNAALAFNEEVLTIMIHESTDPNAESVVFLSVNGEGPGPANTPYVPRGVPVRIKRKFVERLARARPIAYDSIEKVNAEGERTVTYPARSALQYPFSVIEDKNPKGATWLRAITRGV